MSGPFEENVNDIIGIFTAILVFAACWGGIVIAYGTHWGGMFGWAPAFGAAAIARPFWPYVWVLAGVLFIFFGNTITPILRQVYEQYFTAR